MNPWGISDQGAAFMDALCEIGNIPAASEAIGITLDAGRERLRHVRARMAGLKPKRNGACRLGVSSIRACVLWALWTDREGR